MKKTKKPKYVYHGSGKKIGGSLKPRKAMDLGNDQNDKLKGVYATNLKKWAMIMGILSSKGVKESGTHVEGKRKMKGFVFSGWPKQDYFYLYTFPSKFFKEKPKGSAQWISFKPVSPIKIERFPMKKYIHWVKKPTKKEVKEFDKASETQS